MSRPNDSDEFGARMKAFESVETSRKLDPALPVYARIDGRSFSRFTRGMQKPFDAAMTQAMADTTRYLVHATHARFGYTQSDEINLVWMANQNHPESGPLEQFETSSNDEPAPPRDIFFSGKIHKLTSVLASMAAAKFASVIPDAYRSRLPHFDARVFQLPSSDEAANAFLWRAMDCRKNAVQMVAQQHFPQPKLQHKSQSDLHAMIAAIGVNFEDFPVRNRRGVFVRRQNVLRLLSGAELERIPPRHRPAGPVMRSETVEVEMPPFNTISNRVAVIFDGAEPLERASGPQLSAEMTP